MRKILLAPSKIVLGRGELGNLGEYLEPFGKRALLVVHPEDKERVDNALAAAAVKSGVTFFATEFRGECSEPEIERTCGLCRQYQCEVVIGLGGGKAIDTAKNVAAQENLPLVVVPTIASTDAPCSSLSVVYDENGVMLRPVFFKRSPNLVLIDSSIIAKAPVRYLIAGMGDAYATYFEARACRQSEGLTHAKGSSTLAAFALARLCYETLLADGEKAVEANKLKVVTPALENIIEANIVHSGLGFESAGLAGAHAVHNGMTRLPETHKAMHGEKVAFGTLVQLVLENAPEDELRETVDFYRRVGLPLTLAELGVREVNADKLKPVAEFVCSDRSTMKNMPFKVDEDMVISAILFADRLGDIY